jgi:hypothetical protein
MSQEQEIELELWLDTVMYDRTSVRFNLAASNDFVFDEDAAKIFSTETVTPQIYTISNGEKFSVNTIYPAVMDIPLGVKTYKAGTFKFRLTNSNSRYADYCKSGRFNHRRNCVDSRNRRYI